MTTTKEKQATARYRAKHPERAKAAQIAWRKRNPTYHKNHAIGYAKRKLELARARKYADPASRPLPANCECCTLPFDHSIPARRSCYDHDHITGEFRGWICNGCNITIARCGDSRAGVENILAYFDRVEMLR